MTWCRSRQTTTTPTVAEVVAITPHTLRCMPLGAVHGLRVGMQARATGRPLMTPTGPQLLGRVLDGLGRPIDGKGPVNNGPQARRATVSGTAPSALDRSRVDTPLGLGVRALDTIVTVGRGQRIGLFAGSGVGKSSLLSMIARGTEAEVSVIALVGERGREVREFLEDDLGPRVSQGRSSSSPRPTSRRWCACAPPSSPRASPRSSGLKAGTRCS